MTTTTTTTAGTRSNPLLGDYLTHLDDDLDRAESTVEHYEEILARMDAELPAGLNRACAEELQAWISQPAPDGTPRDRRTRAHYATIARGYFAFLCDPADPVLDFNPAALLPRLADPGGTRVRPVETATLFDVLARAAMPYRRWFLVAAYAGLRCVEVAGLKRADITEHEMLINGKGAKVRAVPTHPAIWAAVQAEAGLVCRRANGQRATRQHVSNTGNWYLHHTLGLPGVHMHRLRKWFGTEAYKASGNDILAAQELLGHASPSTTQIYVQPGRAGMERAVAGLPVAG
ncbi:site-specific integrase [Actinoplanes sp. NPDC051470]|uniref:tyrosine-type recombinase/integrase n=1 Tax=Actinoplanes sp. NPDC051470 TaxID=3157224 RepID=UPI00342A4835